MLFPEFHIKEIKKQEGRDLTRFDADFDLPDHMLPEFPPPMFLTNRPDLGDVSKGKLVTIENYYEMFNGTLNPKQLEGCVYYSLLFLSSNSTRPKIDGAKSQVEGSPALIVTLTVTRMRAPIWHLTLVPRSSAIESAHLHFAESIFNDCLDLNAHSRRWKTSPSSNSVGRTLMVIQ